MTPSQIERIRKATRGTKLKRPPVWLFPRGAERSYRRILNLHISEISKLIREFLVPNINRLLEDVESRTPNGDRSDSPIPFLDRIFEEIRERLQPEVDEVIQETENIARNVNQFNLNQFEKMSQSVFGIDIFLDEPWLQDQLSLFLEQNISLIEDLTDDHLLRVRQTVQRGFQQGQRFTDIAKNITKRTGISRRRANTIARDQVSKLNGNLTRLRQEGAGITTYRWITAGDERVRPSHRIMNNLICRWDNPRLFFDEERRKWVRRPQGATLTHPSEEVNCRCQPIGRVEDIIG